MRREIYLILNNIRSAYNVGSIFRTADGAGVVKLYLCGITPIPSLTSTSDERATGQAPAPYLQPTIQKLRLLPNDKITKTALGAEKSVPWEYYSQTWRLLEKLKKEGIRIVALEQATGSKNIFNYTSKFPTAILIGHERKGLSKKILTYVDDIIEIPMHGGKESLNVSVATGIALYSIMYKRNNHEKGN